jgi:ankyrin repeat protein
MRAELGKEGHGWTILHHIAKANASKCMGYCLRWLYQSCPSEYEASANQKTSEGDTPLQVACLHKSNEAMRSLL